MMVPTPSTNGSSHAIATDTMCPISSSRKSTMDAGTVSSRSAVRVATIVLLAMVAMTSSPVVLAFVHLGPAYHPAAANVRGIKHSRGRPWAVSSAPNHDYDRFIDRNGDDEEDEDEDDFDSPPILPFLLDDADPLLQTDATDGSVQSAASSAKLSRSQVESLTVAELKQQLRLRNLKVGGKKSELVDRLLGLEGKASMSIGAGPLETEDNDSDARSSSGSTPTAAKSASASSSPQNSSATSRGTPVDVSAYLDEEDKGKAFKSSDGSSAGTQSESSPKKEDGLESSSASSPYATEVWGEEARIVDDYEGRSIVVDSLSRTAIEYRGYNRTKTQAYVTAHRTALKAFIAGGSGNSTGDNRDVLGETPEQKVARIQRKREEEARITPKDFSDIDAPNTGDEAGYYSEVLERDYGDWGVYSPTGAQISAQEVQGVLLLSDVRGCFHDDTQALADKIAFECQPVVVMAPDLFRGLPWEEDSESKKGPGHNARGENYEQWRSNHPDERVNADIRAAAATLRKQYGVSSIAVFGTCYGGGRALEAAVGWTPSDISTTVAVDSPPPVNPAACIAWYPTRYNASELFGPNRLRTDEESDAETDASSPISEPNLAIMAVFAGLDEIPGARPEDAEALKLLLDEDERIKDRMVKVFPDQVHGFAHVGLGQPDGEGDDSSNFLDEEFGDGGVQPSLARDNGDAEVASLLSTAWMETYSRAFLPTTGVAVMNDADSRGWSEELEMPDLTEANNRDIRQELEEAVKSHKDIPPDLSRMPSYQYGNEVFESEGLDDTLPEPDTPEKPQLDEKLDEVNEDLSRLGLMEEEDDEAYFAKIKGAYDEGKLQSWLGKIPSDARQMPEIPKSGAGYNDEFGLKVLDAMSELDGIGLSKDDDMGTTIQKFKAAMESGKLNRIQELRKERAVIQERMEANKAEKQAAAKAQLKIIGVEEGDDHDTVYRKMKQAIDRGDFDNIASRIAVGGDGEDWVDDDEGPW